MKLYSRESKFTTEEFQCKCGCGFGSKEEDIDPNLIDRLNIIRSLYGKAMVITSGARCEAYNKKVDGQPNSAHLPHAQTKQCRAADISVSLGMSRFQFIEIAINVGFKRIGIASNFIHLDVAWDLPSPVMFTY